MPTSSQTIPLEAAFDLVPTGQPGHFRAVAIVYSAGMALTAETLQRLGIPASLITMRRLIKAGFVIGNKGPPRVQTFEIESWLAHCERVRSAAAQGRDFWTGRNLARYRTRNAPPSRRRRRKTTK